MDNDDELKRLAGLSGDAGARLNAAHDLAANLIQLRARCEAAEATDEVAQLDVALAAVEKCIELAQARFTALQQERARLAARRTSN